MSEKLDFKAMRMSSDPITKALGEFNLAHWRGIRDEFGPLMSSIVTDPHLPEDKRKEFEKMLQVLEENCEY